MPVDVSHIGLFRVSWILFFLSDNFILLYKLPEYTQRYGHSNKKNKGKDWEMGKWRDGLV